MNTPQAVELGSMRILHGVCSLCGDQTCRCVPLRTSRRRSSTMRSLRSEPIHTLRGRNPEKPVGSRRGYHVLQQSTHDLSRTPVCQFMIIAHRTGQRREPPVLCGRHAVAARGPEPPVWNLDGVYIHIVQQPMRQNFFGPRSSRC